MGRERGCQSSYMQLGGRRGGCVNRRSCTCTRLRACISQRERPSSPECMQFPWNIHAICMEAPRCLIARMQTTSEPTSLSLNAWCLHATSAPLLDPLPPLLHSDPAVAHLRLDGLAHNSRQTLRGASMVHACMQSLPQSAYLRLDGLADKSRHAVVVAAEDAH